jgi:hydroxymethylpyrimidine/phosphomethylpyrimidine kinase
VDFAEDALGFVGCAHECFPIGNIQTNGMHVRVFAEMSHRTIEAVLADVVPDAVKLGMILTSSAIKAVARLIGKYGVRSLVIDPVLKSSTGRTCLSLKRGPDGYAISLLAW